MVTSLKNREKKKIIEQLLSTEHVLLHIVPHAPGVKLPVHLMKTHTVTLKISRNFRGSLTLNATSVEAHLLFGTNYFECSVPFESIWGVTSGKGETTSWLEELDERSDHEEKNSTATTSSTPHLRELKFNSQDIKESPVELFTLPEDPDSLTPYSSTPYLDLPKLVSLFPLMKDSTTSKNNEIDDNTELEHDVQTGNSTGTEEEQPPSLPHRVELRSIKTGVPLENESSSIQPDEESDGVNINTPPDSPPKRPRLVRIK
jgi:stringent starvation protein B